MCYVTVSYKSRPMDCTLVRCCLGEESPLYKSDQQSTWFSQSGHDAEGGGFGCCCRVSGDGLRDLCKCHTKIISGVSKKKKSVKVLSM